MEPSSRAYREQSDMQYDNIGAGVQGDNPLSNQDNTGFTGGDTYNSQQLGQGGEYGSNNLAGAGAGLAGPQGGVDIQSDRYTTPGQYGSSDRSTAGQTTGTYADPRIAGAGGTQPDDEEYSDGGPTGKPSMTSRVHGAVEKLAGKVTGDQGKQVRGREREEGTF